MREGRIGVGKHNRISSTNHTQAIEEVLNHLQ